jgi:DNA-binding response OmpR family regulator
MTRLLIIDDDDELRGLIKEGMKAAGFEVADAPNGALGLAMQRSQPAELIITDIFMPGEEGIETIFALQREFPRAGIIAISGGGHRRMKLDYLEVARELGAHACLRKPFEFHDLLEVVRRVLAERARG